MTKACLFGLLFLVATSIAFATPPSNPNAKPNKIAVLNDALPGFRRDLAKTLAARLRQEGFDVSELSAQEACDGNTLSADQFFLYLIPNCQSYPAAGLPALASFASDQGHVLFVGGPFLDAPVWQKNGRWLDRKAVLAAKQNAKPQRHLFAGNALPTTGWFRTCSDRDVRGTWEVVSEGPNGNDCYKFWTEKYVGWDGHASPITPIYGEDHDLFTFLVKGAARTNQIAVEIQEKDGSRWIATTNVGPTWQRIGLALDEFHYWGDSSTRSRRGALGDQLRPQQAERVVFQIAHSHTVDLPQGEHTFWIADVGSCRNPVADLLAADPSKTPQSFETILPRYKVYPLHEQVRLTTPTNPSPLADSDWTSTQNLVCAIPRTMGRGFNRGQKWRYLPMLDATDAKGRMRGSPAWLVINRTAPFGGSVFGCLGFNDPQFMSTPPVLHAITQLVQRISQGVFLAEAGSEHFAYWPGERVVLGATVMNVGNTPQAVLAQLTVRDSEGETVFEKDFAVDLAARQQKKLQDSFSPPTDKPATYSVSARLLNNKKVVDVIEHQTAILGTDPARPEEFVTVREGDFYVGNRKWYPVGINFWPLYVSGMDRDDYWAGWIHRSFYDPELVEQDLKRMKQLGINLVSIQSHEPKFYRNLLDFLRRCRHHQIRVNLYCGLASPLGFRNAELQAFIKTAKLAQNPTIMAYDTIWEPGNYVFRNDRRKRWDVDWRAWIDEQYGSLAAAEQDWEYAAPRDDGQRVTAPSDRYFREDGPWRVMMAAYRRFMDDLTSRKWNLAHRQLRQLDPNHLISFRQGNTLPHDFVFTGTPKHIDFICPEGYAIPPTEDGYYAAGFITRYVHFTTRGKPVVWSEFGQSAWDPQTMEPSEKKVQSVSDYHEMFYRMVLESGANGTIPWWWPGGYRVGERSDYGIINPDGTPRPAAELLAKYGKDLKKERNWPKATVWFDMDRDSHAGGYWHVCFNTGRDAYRKAVEQKANLGIRTAGSGTTSANTPLLAVGNRPYDGMSPLKYLNAEFNFVAIRNVAGRWIEANDGTSIAVAIGEPVKARVSIGNTHEATWLAPRTGHLKPGDVFLQTTAASDIVGKWPIRFETPYLSDVDLGEVTLVEKIQRSVRVELRMAAEARAVFGEKRTFILNPTER